jgi:hypothetical protein
LNSARAVFIDCRTLAHEDVSNILKSLRDYYSLISHMKEKGPEHSLILGTIEYTTSGRLTVRAINF